MSFEFDLNDIVPDYFKTPAEPKRSEGRLIAEQALEGPLREAVMMLPFAQAATGFAPLVGQPSGYDITPQQALEAGRKGLGLSGQEPSTMLGRAAGAGLRTLTSPSTYYAAPLFGMTNPAVIAATAAPSAAAGQIGEEIAGLPGAIVGSIFGGLPGQYLQTGKRLLSQYETAKNAGGAFDELTKEAGSRKAGSLAKKAFESDPDLQGNLLRAREIEQLTGVKLPINAAAQNSNVLLQSARSQAAYDPTFLAKISGQSKQAQEAISARGSKLFGTPSEERLMTATVEPISQARTITQQLDNVDRQLSRLSSKIENIDEVELGGKITNLLKAKEELVRKEVSPLYETAINDATEAGINLSPVQTESIYGFVQANVNKNIFQTFPAIYGKVLSKFKPDVVKTGELDDAGTELTKEVFKSATIRDLDSLKREVNKALRGPVEQDTRRVLNNLKAQVNTVVDELPDTFSGPYRNADAMYLQKIGIPFDAQGIDNIGSKKFVEDTIPTLTKNRSTLQQYIDIGGEDSTGIINDAFMYKLSKTPNLVDENGVINQKVLTRFIDRNESTLNLVPDTAQRLQGLQTDNAILLDTKAKMADLLKIEQRKEAESLFNTIGQGGVDLALTQFIGSPNKRAAIMSQLNKNPEAKQGFQSSMLQQLTDSGNKLEFFNENRKAMETLFGPQYVNQVEALAEATQRLYANPVKLSVPMTTVGRTKYEEVTGMSPESTVALARRQITSPFQKITIGLSKYFQNRASQSEREAIQDFLLDTDKIQKVAAAYKNIELTDNVNDIKQLAKTISKTVMGDISRKSSYGLYMGTATDFGNPETQQPAPVGATEPEFIFQ
jgi:hypothetical protein